MIWRAPEGAHDRLKVLTFEHEHLQGPMSIFSGAPDTYMARLRRRGGAW
jgi:hypothetical protein